MRNHSHVNDQFLCTDELFKHKVNHTGGKNLAAQCIFDLLCVFDHLSKHETRHKKTIIYFSLSQLL